MAKLLPECPCAECEGKEECLVYKIIHVEESSPCKIKIIVVDLNDTEDC